MREVKCEEEDKEERGENCEEKLRSEQHTTPKRKAEGHVKQQTRLKLNEA